ncbi:hypothetical protein G9U51_06035 [Calidifontibacter sp. DB0510]|uniref:Peptide N-acetyl-beta-D-glucosaminyl asparaginase amidase A N-terminal domain-containing protein n=1 Tax=Metallococcus carri TaxID=1656884 RepID=A0A967AZ42_9MICO|nr:peptide-N4-asparagine amidase [Metallococcus carri]NHN55343.1 hypothetical protein [Metallococcus carri]NOP36420.1 hypothetical protein [Calidifontibacter sp. DB2511S]
MPNRHPAILLPAAFALAVAPFAVTSSAAADTGPVTSNPPATFGPTWDSPRTAEQPVPVPNTPSCSVTVLTHGFDNFDVVKTPYTAPTCGTKGYAKAVLKLDGSVKGRQYDRLGRLDINGVRVLTTSTPEPSAAGITWHTEKDVTDLLPVLTKSGTSAMAIGNVVNDTYTGVFNVKVTIDFYIAQGPVKAASTADQVLPLAGTRSESGDLVGTITAPRSSERVTAQVYATGSGGGCEEFWDTSAPASTGYSCPDGLPYREVDVLIDGKLAGAALPIAYVYTGGWSNPFLWYNIPSPGAFNMAPLEYDLTPFVGVLNDGKAHEVRVQVAGGPSNGSGWSLAAVMQVWTDPLGRTLPAQLVSTSGSPAAIRSQVTGQNDNAGSVTMDARRSFTATGWVDTARGRVTTTVQRTLTNASRHTWTDGESRDDLDANWSDKQVVTSAEKNRKPSVATTALDWSKKGYITFLPHPGIPDAYDITTDLTIGINRDEQSTVYGRPQPGLTTTNTFTGQASWLYGVPREQRTASSHSKQVYTARTDGSAYRHTLEAVNGYFTVDEEQGR